MRKRSDVVVSEQRVEETVEVEQEVDRKMGEQHVPALQAATLGSRAGRVVEAMAGLPTNPGISSPGSREGRQGFGVLDGVSRIRVVWGEEKICLGGSFSPVSVGPFEVEFPVPEGTNVVAALEQASRAIASFAEVERERKVQNFLNKLHQVNTTAKGSR